MYVERAGGSWESARISVRADGRVIARSGSTPHGQGHETTFAQIVADRLGVEVDDVEMRFGDTAEVPPGVGTFASRSVAMGGSALVQAADRILEQAARAGRRSRWPRPPRPRAGLEARGRGSSPSSCSARARTRRWSRSTAPPARCRSDGWPRSTTPARSSTRCWPRARCSAASFRDSAPCLMEEADPQRRRPAGKRLVRRLQPAECGRGAADRRRVRADRPRRTTRWARRGSARAERSARRRRSPTRSRMLLGGNAPDPPFTAEKLWRALRIAEERLGQDEDYVPPTLHGCRAQRGPVSRQPSGSLAPTSPVGRPFAGPASSVSWFSTVLRSEVTSRSSGSDPPTV